MSHHAGSAETVPSAAAGTRPCLTQSGDDDAPPRWANSPGQRWRAFGPDAWDPAHRKDLTLSRAQSAKVRGGRPVRRAISFVIGSGAVMKLSQASSIMSGRSNSRSA